MNPQPALHAIAFNGGTMLLLASERHNLRADPADQRRDYRVFFLPTGSDTAYIVQGELRHLFGRIAITVNGQARGEMGYSLVWDETAKGISNSFLSLPQGVMTGADISPQETAKLSAELADGTIKLVTKRPEPPQIFLVKKFSDGRYLICLSDIHSRNPGPLYVGTPGGAWQNLDAQLVIQGGNSEFGFKDSAGQSIYLYNTAWSGSQEQSCYGAEILADIPAGRDGKYDAASLGFALPDMPAFYSPLNVPSAPVTSAAQAAPTPATSADQTPPIKLTF